MGTEIKVTFLAEAPEDNEGSASEMELMKFDDPLNPPTVSLVGFNQDVPSEQLLYSVVCTYLVSWWGFEIRPEGSELGEIVIINNDPALTIAATRRRDPSRPFIILSPSRGSPEIMAIASDYEGIGGFCRIIYKPGGPSRLRSVLKLCLHALKIGSRSQGPTPNGMAITRESSHDSLTKSTDESSSHMPRRNSEESNNWPRSYPIRPAMVPRSSTAHPNTGSWSTLSSTMESDGESSYADNSGYVTPTISVGSSGTLLKSSVGTIDTTERRFRVLVVEDNSILRSLLCVL